MLNLRIGEKSMILELFQEYKKIIALFAVLFTGLLVGYGIFVSIDRAGKIEYTIRSVPHDVTITLNGTRVKPGKLYLAPGRYTITATKEGFTTYNQSTYLTSTLEPEINIPLTAVSEEAKQWAREHKDDYERINKYIADKTNIDKNQLKLNNSITEKLPFTNMLYTIDYAPDPDDPEGDAIMLNITSLPGKRLSALYIIRQLGYDPTDYRINFTNFTGMF